MWSQRSNKSANTIWDSTAACNSQVIWWPGFHNHHSITSPHVFIKPMVFFKCRNALSSLYLTMSVAAISHLHTSHLTKQDSEHSPPDKHLNILEDIRVETIRRTASTRWEEPLEESGWDSRCVVQGGNICYYGVFSQLRISVRVMLILTDLHYCPINHIFKWDWKQTWGHFLRICR